MSERRSGSRVNVAALGRLRAFSHAVVAGDLVFVSGTLGTQPGSMELVPGGTGPETTQTLRNIEATSSTGAPSRMTSGSCRLALRSGVKPCSRSKSS